MIELPPPLILPEPPAIIRPLEGGLWHDLDQKMQRLGMERRARRAVLAEMRRVVGGKPAIVKTTAADLGRYAGKPILGSMLINPFIFSPPPPPIGSFVTTPAAQTNNSATYTFSSVSTGVADANRITPLVVHWELSTTDRAPTNMTMDNGDGAGDRNMTLVQTSHAGSGHGVAIYRVANATGTTATFKCAGSSDSGVFLAMQISIYRVVPASATPVDSGANAGATPVTVADIEVKAGGFLICAGVGNTNAAQSAVYNGADTPVVDLSNTLEATSCRCISWSMNTTENVTTNDPGVSGPTNNRVVAASWL